MTPATPDIPVDIVAQEPSLGAPGHERGHATAQDARAQTECTVCPPWVVRCAHWEEQVLRLVDARATKLLHDPSCGCQSFGPNYVVAKGGYLSPAACGCDMENFWGASERTKFADLPAAEAEFAKRERELLGRSDE